MEYYLPDAPVTVVIPCFRCTKTIRRAVISVTNQTRKPVEIVMVDDASPDDTLNVLYELQREFPSWIKIIPSPKNLGPASARNAGWDVATQPFIAFLDADDAWHPKKIEIQYHYMLKHPRITLSGHGSRLLYDDSNPLNWKLDQASVQNINLSQLLLSNRFITPSIMVRREIPERFDVHQRYMEDHRLWLEIVSSKYLVVRLNVDLAAVYKPMYGASGLSSNLWSMEKAELFNYQYLYENKKISFFHCGFLQSFSLAKFFKRLVVVYLIRPLQAGKQLNSRRLK